MKDTDEENKIGGHYEKVREFIYWVWGALAFVIGIGIWERVQHFIDSLIPNKLSGFYALLGIYYEIFLNIAAFILTIIIVGIPFFFLVRLLTSIVMAIYVAIHAQWKKLP